MRRFIVVCLLALFACQPSRLPLSGAHRISIIRSERIRAAFKAGALYPNTIFITTSGSSVSKNVSLMVFQMEQATYLLGIVAARESKSGKAGVVGGARRLLDVPSAFVYMAKTVRGHKFRKELCRWEGSDGVRPSFSPFWYRVERNGRNEGLTPIDA